MNIDLLLTKKGAAGFIANAAFPRKIAGVLFEPEAATLGMEFVDMDSLELNIPVGENLAPLLSNVHFLYIAAYVGGQVAQAYQVPFMIVGDALHAAMATRARPHPAPLAGFTDFLAACTWGQPVHRTDLGDDTTKGCVLGEAAPAALQFAPHLAQQRALEAAPQVPQYVIGPAGPSGMGGGGGARGGSVVPPPREEEDA